MESRLALDFSEDSAVRALGRFRGTLLCVLLKLLHKQVSVKNQWQKATQWHYKETPLGYTDDVMHRELRLLITYGWALVDWTSLAKFVFNSTTKSRSWSSTHKNSGILWKNTMKSTIYLLICYCFSL